ncbi:DEAD/DEAH box helicase [Methanofollis aquaemaris]|uniref:DEAD/DEAH box helicase n=1 Tax=Methanofollis aquaemaris TaxID=126734 RepID=A0A8A3S5S0_9EURY|nr:DEAD/DEAH box helicase [Methanofollis aquaemaris]QSZ67607.1 DEAD/DEAH box helicase [Methanofollis aquaemaris]
MSSVYAALHPTLRNVLAHRLGWDDLRPVQEEACRAAADGADLLVVAGTAGGKTEAAFIPVIDTVLKEGLPGVACLCLFPLKALINDQAGRVEEFCTPAGLSVTRWHGDVGRGERSWVGGDPPHVLLTTPESLEVILLDRGLRAALKNLRFVIVDELHAFVGDLRGVQVRCLLDRLDEVAGRPLQRIGLSATVGNPEEVLDWFSGPDRRRRLVAVPAPPGKKQFSFVVARSREERAGAVARLVAGQRALVFVGSRSQAEGLAGDLTGAVGDLSVHHSSLSPAVRRAAEESLAGSGSACVICTSTLELGIDIGGLDLVVQVGPPPSVSSFLQRLGRTGRRGSPARMAFVLGDDLALLIAVATVEAAVSHEVEPLTPPRAPYTVLVQQLFLPLLARGRVPSHSLVAGLCRLAPFAGMEVEVTALIEDLLTSGYLTADRALLMLGPEAERTLSRSHWADLLSVFTSAAAYRALTPEGEAVGELDARFVAGGAGTVCTLGGRRWRIIALDQDYRIATVVPAGGGPATSDRRPFWSGTGAPLSPVVAASVRRLLVRGCSILPLGRTEQAVVGGFALEIGGAVPPDGFLVLERSEGIVVLSFHGSRFNRVLAYLLSDTLPGGPKVRAADLWLLVEEMTGPDPTGEVTAALAAVRGLGADDVAAALPLPDPEEWKFGSLLPQELFAGMAAADRNDCPGFVLIMKREDIFMV